MDLGSVWTWLLCGLSSFGDFCGESYVGAFTEVAWIEETKAVAHGTGAWYGRVLCPYQVLQAPKLLRFTTPLTW